MNTQMNLLQRLSLILLLLLSVLPQAKGTQQRPDKMTYGDIKMGLETSWAYPSPLELYFYQNKRKSPFSMISTGNYRGFIADWEIKDKKLFLHKIAVRNKEYTPAHFKVESTIQDYNFKKTVFADWFSGIIECSFRKEDDFNHITTYFFQVREGEIIAENKVSGHLAENDYFSKLKDASLRGMHSSYMAFYYQRCDDEAKLDGVSCRLHKSYSWTHPIAAYYGPSVMDFTYNWENEEKSGHPYASWEIKENWIYLTDLSLRYGNRLDTVYEHSLDLGEEFGERLVEGKVKADWVNGVQLLKFGEVETKVYPSGYEEERFKLSHLVFIRIKNGELIERHRVEKHFDFEDVPKNTDPGLKKMIEEYFAKS